MKYILPFCVLLTVFSSCESKKGFTIKGTVKNVNAGTIYLVNLHTEKADTLVMTEGTFELKGAVTEPTPFYIVSQEVLPSSSIFFVENGTTKIEFTANEPSTMKVKGCAAQKEYEKFNKQLKPILAEIDSAQVMASSGTMPKPAIQQMMMDLQNKYIRVNLNFINENKASYASALLAYEYLRQDPSLSIEERKSFLASLDPKIQESHYGKKMMESIQEAEAKAAATDIGKPAPPISLKDTKDQLVSLSDYKGKYVLIDFWASWCAPCRAENPNVLAAYNKYKSKNFTVLGVSLDDNKKKWLEAIQYDKLPWTNISDLQGWNSQVVSPYNISSIPASFLIDPKGNIIAKNLRGADLENELSKLIK